MSPASRRWTIRRADRDKRVQHDMREQLMKRRITIPDGDIAEIASVSGGAAG